MRANLRPMTLGEILDRTFQIYRARFLVFVMIGAIPALVMLALLTLNQYWWKLRVPNSPLRFLAFGISDLVFLLAVYHVSLFLNTLSWACCADAASNIYFGEPASTVAAFTSCGRRWRSRLGLTGMLWLEVLPLPELVGVILWVGILALLSEGIKLDSDTMEAVIEPSTVVLTTLMWAGSVWFSGVLSCSIPVWAVEKTNIRAALQRARTLSRQSRWRIIFTRLAAACLGWVLAIALTSTVLLVIYFLMRHSSHFWFQYRSIIASVRLISTAVVSTLAGPIFPIATTLFYYDQRIRQEGFDIEVMMNAAGMNAPVSAAPTSLPAVADAPAVEVAVTAAEPEERPA